VTVWRNWTGEQACVPRVVARPRSTGEVAEEVRRAAAAGHTVRVAGAGHSFTDAVLTDGTLLSLDAMDRVLDTDVASGLVRVQAGIRIHALSEQLAARGLALENLGDINVQSIAGATATGTHGTGSRLQNISSQVVAVQLVTAGGEVRELDGGDLLRAARVSVGALGVVTEMTLRAIPLYTLRGVDEPRLLAEVMASLDELADASRHFEFYVFPHSDLALTRTNEIVDEPPRPPGDARRWFEDVLLGNHALRAVCEAGKRLPHRIPQINRAVARSFTKRVRVDRSDRVFSSPRLVRFTEMEQAFPRESAAEVVPEILATLERYPVVFPIEVRFVAGDDALLSPAGGRDTVYVAVHNFVGMPWEGPLRAVQAIGDRHGARPHWGKRHFHTAATLAPRYPEWEAFARIREELDPEGVFANDYVRRSLVGAGVLAARP
jgi:L-gulono-1,4-lactone dehydrogenase